MEDVKRAQHSSTKMRQHILVPLILVKSLNIFSSQAIVRAVLNSLTKMTQVRIVSQIHVETLKFCLKLVSAKIAHLSNTQVIMSALPILVS